MKRIYIYTLLLIAALVAPPITLAAQAATTVIASGYCGAEGYGSNLKWKLTSDSTLTISGTGGMKDYSISSSERAPWYGYSGQLRHLIIQSGVTTIGICAFDGCSGFTGTLVIPDGVTSIGGAAFRGCSGFVGSLTIPDGVTTIGNGAFKGCSGFTGTLTIPESVTSIGEYAFEDCNGLTSCCFNAVRCADFDYYDSSVSFDKYPFALVEFTSFTFGDKVEHIPANILRRQSRVTGTLTIPESVTTIGEYAFYVCSGFTGSLTIPDGVTTIGNYAFSGCSGFTGTLTIGNSVTTIGESAFFGCSGLTSCCFNAIRCADFDYNRNPLADVGFTSFTFGDKVEHIPANILGGQSKVTGITIGNSVTTIGESAFFGCSGLTSCCFKAIRCADFDHYNNPLADVGFTSFTFGDKVEHIPANILREQSKVTGTLTIPESVTSIGEYAFDGCSGFTGSLTIPESVTTIGGYAFYGCSGFTDYDIKPTTPPALGYGVFDGSDYYDKPTTDGKKAFIPDGTRAAYERSGWGQLGLVFADNADADLTLDIATPGTLMQEIKTAGATLKNVAKLTLTGMLNDADWAVIKSDMPTLYSLNLSGIENITMPSLSDVKRLIEFTFSQKLVSIPSQVLGSNITGSLTIPESVTEIDSSAFVGCSRLTGLTIGESVTEIGDCAFYDCSGLTGTLTIPDGVTKIGGWAFLGCSGLTGLTIGESVTEIDYGAFRNCSGLTGTLTIPDGVTKIGGGAFSGCSGLTGLTIGESVTEIDYGAFEGCSGLTGEVVLSNSVAELSTYGEQFANTGINAIVFGKGIKSIPSSIVYGCQIDSITCLSIIPPKVDADFSSVDPSTCKLKVPAGTTNIYKQDPVWCKFLNIIEMPVEYYSVTISSTNGHIITSETNEEFVSNVIEEGSILTLKIVPDEGYRLLSLTIDGENYLDSVAADGTFSTPLITDDMNINAIFEAIPVYTLTVDINDSKMGEVIATGGKTNATGKYFEGSVVTLTAKANHGYEFVKWEDGSTRTIRTVTMTKDMTMKATFKAIPMYTLTIDINDSEMGEVTATGGKKDDNGKYFEGSVVTLTAKANDGYEFVKWENGSTNTTRTVTMTKDTTVKATFKITPKPQIITWNQAVTEFQEGETIELTAEASSGLTVEYTVISGNATISGSKLTATAPGEIIVEATQPGNDEYLAATAVGKTFTAIAKQKPQTITWNQAVTEFQEGETIELTAEASSGLTVEYTVISGNATISGSKLTATAPGEITVEATQPGNDEYLAAESVRKDFKATAVQSDIDLVFSDTSIVNVVDNELIIESGNYTLYDVRGMLVEKGIAPTRITLQRNTTYILRIDDKSAKFMIR